MKKFLLITLAMLLVLGSFAKSNFDKVNTVYTNIPVKIIFKNDTVFSVMIDEYDDKYIQYEVVDDTLLKITHKGFWFEMNERTPVVRINTPKTLNVECSRYLRKYN